MYICYTLYYMCKYINIYYCVVIVASLVCLLITQKRIQQYKTLPEQCYFDLEGFFWELCTALQVIIPFFEYITSRGTAESNKYIPLLGDFNCNVSQLNSPIAKLNVITDCLYYIYTLK